MANRTKLLSLLVAVLMLLTSAFTWIAPTVADGEEDAAESAAATETDGEDAAEPDPTDEDPEPEADPSDGEPAEESDPIDPEPVPEAPVHHGPVRTGSSNEGRVQMFEIDLGGSKSHFGHAVFSIIGVCAVNVIIVEHSVTSEN